MSISITQRLTVRALYIVPSDKQPWPEIQVRMTEVLSGIQSWFAYEMDQRGYGKLTFNIARDSGGLLSLQPIPTEFSTSQFPIDGNDIVKFCKEKILDPKRLRSKKGGDAVIYFLDSCRFDNETGKCSGSITRGTASDGRRECFIGAAHFKMARKEWLRSKEPYAGMMIPELCDKPLLEAAFRENCGIPSDRPYTLGELSGRNYGAIAHELGHAFGLVHAFALAEGNDKNRKGYLMGKGFRGMQGYFAPCVTDDFCHLSSCSAKYLFNNQLLSTFSEAT